MRIAVVQFAPQVIILPSPTTSEPEVNYSFSPSSAGLQIGQVQQNIDKAHRLCERFVADRPFGQTHL